MRKPYTDPSEHGPSLQGRTLPRVITLGGDHTIVLPILRSVKKAYGPISVIHFDSHLLVAEQPLLWGTLHSLTVLYSDTWKPKVFGGSPSEVASINHGTYFVTSLNADYKK